MANIQSLKNIEVRSQQEGILQQVYVNEGQYVKAGQPLFRLAIVGADEEIAKSKSAQEQAQIELQNTSKLTENNVISPNARRMAKAKLQSAVADYRLAVQRKRLSVIRAPFSGVLGRIPEKLGSYIQQDDLLTTLSDNTQMQVYFNISETDYLDFQEHPERYMQLPLEADFGEWKHISSTWKKLLIYLDSSTVHRVQYLFVRSLRMHIICCAMARQALFSYSYRRKMPLLFHKRLFMSYKIGSMFSL